MKKVLAGGLLFFGLFFCLTNVSFAALTFYDSRSAWEAAVGSFANADLDSQVEVDDYISSVELPSGDYAAFDSSFMGINDPRALAADSGWNYGWFEDSDGEWISKNAFGFEIAPYLSSGSWAWFMNEYSGIEGFDPTLLYAFDITLSAYDDEYYGSDGYIPSLTQRAGIIGEPKFFGWVGGNVWDFDISVNDNIFYDESGNPYYINADGIILSSLVEGYEGGSITGDPVTSATPEPASMSLLGLGLLGLVRKLRRK